MEQKRRLGNIQVTTQAVTTLASKAVFECYGVVGMASKTLRDGLAILLQRDSHNRGIEVHFVKNRQIIVDVYVVLEYGLRISEVSHSIMSSVRFAVERALDLPVVQVNVNVQGVRVSNVD